MKKLITLFALLLTFITAQAEERELTVASGSTPLPMTLLSDWSVFTTFATSQFADAMAGDVLTVYVSDVKEGAQISLKDMSNGWPALETSTEYPSVATTATQYTYTFTAETVTKVQTNGLVIGGQLLTVNRVTLTLNGGTSTGGTVIWEGSTALDWRENYGVSVSLAAEKFASAKAGHILKIEGTDTNEYTQVQVCVNYPWKASDSYTSLPISYTIAADDLDNIKGNGMTIAGQYATITKVTLVSDDDPGDEPVAGESYTAWTGEKVFVKDWSEWIMIPASAFAKAQKNMLLRFKFKDVKAGAQFKLSTASWADMPDAPIVNIDGVYQQYTMTESMLAELQANGGIISGISYTLTSIEVINPGDLKSLTLSVPVTDNWVYTDAAPSFTIHAANPYNETVTANCIIAITTDKMEPVTTLTKEVELAVNATEDIKLVCTEELSAGIYKATATVNDDLARGFYFAVKPTEIVSAPNKQSDFDSYWAAVKTQLAAVPINATLTEIPAKSTANRKVYLVEMQSIADGTSGDPVIVRGYYAEPQDGKKHPVIMHYLGYDSGYAPGGQSNTPWCPGGDDNKDYAEFYLSTRGQSVNNRPAADRADGINKDFENIYGDWFAYQFGNKDSYYYRGAYMDCVRAIDFMASRETSDMDNLFAEGQSQGGALTVAAAALSGRTFNAIAPAITFMGDFPDYFDIVSWPGYVAKNCQADIVKAGGTMTDADMYAFLSYYDTKNLATAITSPYITSVGLQDNVCPPHTNLAPYNNAQTPAVDKQVVFNPELQHQVKYDGEDNWNTTFMNFFKKYVKNTTGITDVTAQTTAPSSICYDLQGRRVQQPARGLYIQNGRKYLAR